MRYLRIMSFRLVISASLSIRSEFSLRALACSPISFNFVPLSSRETRFLSMMPLISKRSELIRLRFSSDRTSAYPFTTFAIVLSFEHTEFDERVRFLFGLDDGVHVDIRPEIGHYELIKSPFQTRFWSALKTTFRAFLGSRFGTRRQRQPPFPE